jgi:hypothetical protein
VGRPCSEETRQRISFAKTGLVLSAEEKHARRLAHNTAYRKRLRAEAYEKLGNRCASPTCRWLNPDGTFGCIDLRVLQVDHVNGGGYKERKNINQTKVYVLVMNDRVGTYQLLCPTCNWIKRVENEEFAQHTPEGRLKMSQARKATAC